LFVILKYLQLSKTVFSQKTNPYISYTSSTKTILPCAIPLPLTTRCFPVTREDISLAKKSTAFATSSGVPTLLIGHPEKTRNGNVFNNRFVIVDFTYSAHWVDNFGLFIFTAIRTFRAIVCYKCKAEPCNKKNNGKCFWLKLQTL